MGLTNNLGKLSNMITSTGSAVGIAQSSPSYTLDVTGTGRFTGALTALQANISSGSSSYGTWNGTTSGAGFLALQYNGSAYGWIGQGSAIVTAGSNTDMAISYNNNLVFSQGAGAEKMRITSAGVTKFTPATDRGIRISGTLSTESVLASYQVFTENIRELRVTGSTLFFNTGDGSNSTGSERMRITEAGNVLVGETSYSGANPMFEVKTASAREGISIISNSGYSPLVIRNAAASNSYMFYVNESNVGYLNASAWSYGSDKRIKENISYLDESGLNKVLKLKAARFDYINGAKNNIGWIAQDIQEVIPEAVNTISEDNDQLTLKSDFIVPYLVKAIQELNQTINQQQEQINSLINK